MYIYGAYAVHAVVDPVLSLLPSDVFGARADPEFVHSVVAGRITSAVASTLAVPVIYASGRTAFGSESGLAAAAVLAASALPIQLAHFATPDSTVLLLVSLVLLALLRAAKMQSGKWLVLGGLLAGLAVGTEYHMALLLCPLLATWASMTDRRRRWLVVASGCVVAGYLVSNPYVIVDSPSFAAAMRHTVLIHTVDSTAQYQGRFNAYGPDWLYVVRYPLGYGVGICFTIWSLLGLAWAVASRDRSQLILLAWIVPYGLVVSLSAAKFMRYSLPLMPALAILAGGVAWSLVTTRHRPLRSLAAAAALVAILYTVVYDSAYASLFSRPESRLVVTDWVQHNVATRSLLAYEQLPNGLINLPYFTSSLGYPPCFTQFRANWIAGSVRYVLTDGYDVEEHPRFSASSVQRFRASLANPQRFRVAERVHYEPAFLGLTFSIDASPHDWRYPDRDITVFRRLGPTPPRVAHCYRSVSAAVAALYPHAANG